VGKQHLTRVSAIDYQAKRSTTNSENYKGASSQSAEGPTATGN